MQGQAPAALPAEGFTAPLHMTLPAAETSRVVHLSHAVQWQHQPQLPCLTLEAPSITQDNNEAHGPPGAPELFAWLLGSGLGLYLLELGTGRSQVGISNFSHEMHS